jgi:Cu+-exporting ATPase
MNGTLAWTQSAGMPMRPTMSTMMTTEIPPVDAAEADVHVQVSVPAGTRPGLPTHVIVKVTDGRTGSPVTDLGLTHSVFMHLIATRADLATFTHVHPEPTGTAGEFAVQMTFPTPGRYILNTEFRRNGQMADIHDRQLVTIAGPAPTPRPVTPRRGPSPSTASASSCTDGHRSARPAT